VQKTAIHNWIKGSILCSDTAALGWCLKKNALKVFPTLIENTGSFAQNRVTDPKTPD